MINRDDESYAIDNLTIGEIDLAVLGRAYRVINMYCNTEHKSSVSEQGEPTIRETFVNWLVTDGPYEKERNIALRMMFEEMLAVPDVIKRVDKVFEHQFTFDEERESYEYEEGTEESGYGGY